MSDGILQLAHDHALLNHRIVSLASLVRELESHALAIANALLIPLDELRDQLFGHFAREEEALFRSSWSTCHCSPSMSKRWSTSTT